MSSTSNNFSFETFKKRLSRNYFDYTYLEEIINNLDNLTPEQLNKLKDTDGNTSLHFAILKKENKDIIKLLNAGADANIKDNIGYTALFNAFLSNLEEDTIKKIIESGGTINAVDNFGNNFLMTLLIDLNYDIKDESDMKVIRLLIDNGIDLNYKNKSGDSILHLVVESFYKFNKQFIEYLVEKGADINITDNFGITPLILAVMKNNPSLVEFLLEQGADKELKTKDGKTAIDIANEEQLTNIINILKGFGVRKNDSKDEENELLNQRIRVNITKTVNFEDPIMLTNEKINIEEYIEEDKNNIVIVYNKNNYFFTNRDTINNQKDDAIVYPCLEPDTMREGNILRQRPLYDLKKIGFVGAYFCDIKDFIDNKKHQLFAIINTEEKYPSFVSDEVLNRSGTVVSALHCQAGQDSKVSFMISAIPSTKDNEDSVQMGGLRKMKAKVSTLKIKKQMKKHKNKKNKVKKSIKKKGKKMKDVKNRKSKSLKKLRKNKTSNKHKKTIKK